MEDRRDMIEQPVHALQHEFQASHTVMSALRKFLVPSANQVPLTVFGSKIRLLDVDAFKAHEYDGAIGKVKEHLRHYEGSFYLSGRTAIRALDRRFGRIGLEVKNQVAFDALLNDLDHLPDVRSDVDGGNHWLYADVALSALSKDISVRTEASQHLRAATEAVNTTHFYWLKPLRLFERRGIVKKFPPREPDQHGESLRHVS